jgi:hypothetical protein
VKPVITSVTPSVAQPLPNQPVTISAVETAVGNTGTWVWQISGPTPVPATPGTPGQPFTFGGGAPGTYTVTLTVTANGLQDSRSANFTVVALESLTVSTVSNGQPLNDTTVGAVTVNGTDCGSGCTRSFRAGTVVTLTAVVGPVQQRGAFPARPAFTGWGGACSGAGTTLTCTLTMTGPMTVTAGFIVLL